MSHAHHVTFENPISAQLCSPTFDPFVVDAKQETQENMLGSIGVKWQNYCHKTQSLNASFAFCSVMLVSRKAICSLGNKVQIELT